jgi:hypothetical protein
VILGVGLPGPPLPDRAAEAQERAAAIAAAYDPARSLAPDEPRVELWFTDLDRGMLARLHTGAELELLSSAARVPRRTACRRDPAAGGRLPRHRGHQSTRLHIALQQLARQPLDHGGVGVVLVCENPAVLRAGAEQLGTDSAGGRGKEQELAGKKGTARPPMRTAPAPPTWRRACVRGRPSRWPCRSELAPQLIEHPCATKVPAIDRFDLVVRERPGRSDRAVRTSAEPSRSRDPCRNRGPGPTADGGPPSRPCGSAWSHADRRCLPTSDELGLHRHETSGPWSYGRRAPTPPQLEKCETGCNPLYDLNTPSAQQPTVNPGRSYSVTCPATSPWVCHWVKRHATSRRVEPAQPLRHGQGPGHRWRRLIRRPRAGSLRRESSGR